MQWIQKKRYISEIVNVDWDFDAGNPAPGIGELLFTAGKVNTNRTFRHYQHLGFLMQEVEPQNLHRVTAKKTVDGDFDRRKPIDNLLNVRHNSKILYVRFCIRKIEKWRAKNCNL